MSITAETAQEHAKDLAVLCCRAEAGTVITPENLEDPAIFLDLEESGLLEFSEDVLTIEQVLGTTLKETTDALIPLTKELLEGVSEGMKEVHLNEKKEVETSETIATPTQAASSSVTSGQTIKIHIAEGKGIDLELPLMMAAQLTETVNPAPESIIPEQVTPIIPAPVLGNSNQVKEKVIRSVRHDHLKIDQVIFGEETKIEGTTLILRKMTEICAEAVELEQLVEDMTLEIITPDKYTEYSETIMDVQPIAAKVEGDLGHGITRVLDGVVMVVTGTDANGVQIGEFGSSEGELDRNIILVVNNNAAAIMLILDTLATDKEVLVSRGELVEIGGSFRIPEVITATGGKIREVGTTNKTHIRDYQQALTSETGAILKVHTSNYRIIGFTETPYLSELALLAQKHQVPLINDLGSGLLIDMRRFGLPYEPTVREVIEQGCDVVSFSGDKLLGGPQAGIIVGKKTYIQRMKENQLLRALRVDKMTLSALEATLELYLDEEEAIRSLPTLQMLSDKIENCLNRAQILAEKLKKIEQLEVSIEKDYSTVGGGTYPESLLPTYAVTVKSKQCHAEEVQRRLRKGIVPVISRVKNERNYLDMRTIFEEELHQVFVSLEKIFCEEIT